FSGFYLKHILKDLVFIGNKIADSSSLMKFTSHTNRPWNAARRGWCGYCRLIVRRSHHMYTQSPLWTP
ncbi:MAG: hypothetical protein J6S16_04135, partial [Bacteroidales bacterium]|nr:hypothetical protein [Bacteroidales bacterium]